MAPFLPSTLASLTIRDWQFPAHLKRLERACLRLVTDPSYNRLIVELPLRHGKSHYCSWVFPAWFLLLHPDAQVILATYQATFAGEWANKVLGTVRDYGPQLTGVDLGDIRRRDHFTLSRPYKGQLRTASPSGGVAGKGADLIVADDLVRDMKEVSNPARRHSLDTWCNGELLARLEPAGKVLVVMSRRHPDDQSGRFLSQNPELPPGQRWHVVRMPAIDEAGNALWPERYSLDRLLAIKRRFELAGMSYLWDSLYQQEPKGDATLVEWPEEWFDGVLYDELPPDLPVRLQILALDPSKGSNAKRGDYASFSDIILDRAGVLWVVPHLARWPTSTIEDHAVGLMERTRYDGVVVEANGFQAVLAQNIRDKARAKGIWAPVHLHENSENKVVRIRLDVGPLLAQKRVRIKGGLVSSRLAVNQLKEFPTAAHDDFPDSVSLGTKLINYILTGTWT